MSSVTRLLAQQIARLMLGDFGFDGNPLSLGIIALYDCFWRAAHDDQEWRQASERGGWVRRWFGRQDNTGDLPCIVGNEGLELFGIVGPNPVTVYR